MKKQTTIYQRMIRFFQDKSLQFVLTLTFTAVAITVTIGVAIGFATQYRRSAEALVADNNKNVVDQVNINLDNYLHNMIRLSNTMYYSVIKNSDFDQETSQEITEKMRPLYELNDTSLVNLAIFSETGRVLASLPLAELKPNADPAGEEWFMAARQQIENVHFSSPRVEKNFVNADHVYHWVVSLSRSVELTRGGETQSGVLLVNMNFSGIEEIAAGVNLGESGYIYIVDAAGELVYHPRQQLIYSGIAAENNFEAAGYSDGSHREEFQGEERQITVKTMGYTGWKIIAVAPMRDLEASFSRSLAIIWIVALVAIILLILANFFVSSRITDPIKQLEKAVKKLERQNFDGVIPVNGTYEIRHLARTLQNMVASMRGLMDDIVREHESKRKSEMAVLQSQINPHFLYNTLDSVVWMIENKRYEGAISMITALAALFRISLSKGKNIITIAQEMQHVENYLIIQRVRYRNRFVYDIRVDEGLADCGTIKLIVQPLVENAIYHGMEFMDGEGEISIHVYAQDGFLKIAVADNGPGMTPGQVAALIAGRKDPDTTAAQKGSGVGFQNIKERLELFFGSTYGLAVESEPDEGTVITITLPRLSVAEMERMIEHGEA